MESSHLVKFSTSGKFVPIFNVLCCISLSETLFWTGASGRIPITLSCKLTLRFIWPVYLRFYDLVSLFADTIQLFDSYRILKEKDEMLPVWCM